MVLVLGNYNIPALSHKKTLYISDHLCPALLLVVS